MFLSVTVALVITITLNCVNPKLTWIFAIGEELPLLIFLKLFIGVCLDFGRDME